MTAHPGMTRDRHVEHRRRAAEHDSARANRDAVRRVFKRDGYWAARVKASELGYNAYAARMLVDAIQTEGNER